MLPEQILTCALDIGEQMLISGAEVHRVEDSVNRMCTALGAARVDCFIITSSICIRYICFYSLNCIINSFFVFM